MATEKNATGTLSLNIQHEFITLRTPNGNFTTSYSGAKTSGNMASVRGLVEKLDNYVQNFKGTKGDAMRSLMDESKLAEFWPEWNKKYEITIKVDDIVSIKGMPKYKNGKVEKLNKKNANIRFNGNQLVSVPYNMIEPA